MITIEVLAARFPDLTSVEITRWVQRGWVRPDPEIEGGTWVFREVDVARVGLIRDLRRDLDVNEDAVPVVLSLLDQVYDLRRTLRAVSRAIDEQPASIRDALHKALLPR